ncbi:nitroreductase family protein [Mariniflexile sp.]|uniref:nitroreductase family protein n=1 Tax=Mariniflexile sp. TaxID=1979402 RepID=UPI00356A13F6
MKNLFQRVKSKLHALIFWQSSIGDFANKMYDLKLFYKYSFKNNNFKSKESEIAFLTKQYHIVEKGLALPNPRLGFGKEKINLLVDRTKQYYKKNGDDALVISIKNCLLEYIEFNKKNNVKIEGDYFKSITDFIGLNKNHNEGGTLEINKTDLQNRTNIDFENFVKSRFSVRDFAEKDVEIEVIKKAVNIAKYAPSVCNRQSWKAHVYTQKENILSLLKIQGGSNGFSDNINKLIIITTDTKAFTKLESNQIYIDGGLFSMNLVLSLHSQGIGACCLNTCFPFTSEKKVKQIGTIPENEKVIMMIGIGNLKETYKVAISRKKDLTQIMTIH